MSESLWDEDSTILLNALRERSPRTTDELLRLVDPSATSVTIDDVADILEERSGVYELPGDQWAWLPTLLNGRVFTHRVGTVELAHDAILIDVDLVTPLMLTELPDFRQLTDGSPIRDLHPAMHRDALVERGVPVDGLEAEGVLLLAPGRLRDLGVAAGELVALRVTDEGFDLSAVAEAPPSPVVPAIAATAMADPERPTDLFDVVLSLCADHDEVLREPSAPLGESLRADGLAIDGDLIASEDFDFAHARAGQTLERIKEQYELDEGEAAAVAIIVGRCDDIAAALDRSAAGDAAGERGDDWPVVSDAPGSAPDKESEREAVAASIDLLAVPEVAEAVRWELDPSDARSSAALGTFADRSVLVSDPAAPRPVRQRPG